MTKYLQYFYSCVFIVIVCSLTIQSNGETPTQNIRSSIPWNLDQIEINGAWEFTRGNRNSTVAIIDTGIDFSHPSITHAQWINKDEIHNNSIDDDNNGYIDDYLGWDWVNGDNNPGSQVDDQIHHHGTFITGIIAGNNGEIVGVAPNCTVMALRVVDLDTLIPNPNGLEEAIDYAINNGADVISLSLDLIISPLGFRDAIRRAVAANIPVVGSTGNSDDGTEPIVLPGRFSEVITVGASNINREKAEYSNSGPEIELLAPGGETASQEIFGASIGGLNRTGYGTSFAAPHVAGVICLIKSLRNDLLVSEIREILHTTATDIEDEGWDEETGYGIVNATAATRLALEYTVQSSSTSGSPNPFDFSSLTVLEVLVLTFLTIPVYKKFKRKK